MLRTDAKVKSVEKVIRKYGDIIKVWFIQAASKGGNYPHITWNAFQHFCVEANIPDKKGAKIANIDRTFV